MTSQHVAAFFSPWDLPPGFVAAPSDAGLAQRIAKLTEFAARNGPSFVEMMKERQRDNPEYAFLHGGEGADFYRWSLYCQLYGLPPNQPQLGQQQPGGGAAAAAAAPAAGPAAPAAQQQPQQPAAAAAANAAPAQPAAPAAPAAPVPADTSAALATLPAEVSSGFQQVLGLLTGSRDSIRNSQSWFMACAPYAEGMAEMMLQHVLASSDYAKQQSVIYLANDILFKALAQRSEQGPGAAATDPVAAAFRPRLGRMLARAYETGGKAEQVQQGLARVVNFWAERGVYDHPTVEALTMEMMGISLPSPAQQAQQAQHAAPAATAAPAAPAPAAAADPAAAAPHDFVAAAVAAARAKAAAISAAAGLPPAAPAAATAPGAPGQQPVPMVGVSEPGAATPAAQQQAAPFSPPPAQQQPQQQPYPGQYPPPGAQPPQAQWGQQQPPHQQQPQPQYPYQHQPGGAYPPPTQAGFPGQYPPPAQQYPPPQAGYPPPGSAPPASYPPPGQAGGYYPPPPGVGAFQGQQPPPQQQQQQGPPGSYPPPAQHQHQQQGQYGAAGGYYPPPGAPPGAYPPPGQGGPPGPGGAPYYPPPPAPAPAREPSPEPQKEPFDPMSFPPGLIPRLVEELSKTDAPYSPLGPLDIERTGVPPAPNLDAYLKSRVDKFYAQLQDYRPGMLFSDIEVDVPRRKHFADAAREEGGGPRGGPAGPLDDGSAPGLGLGGGGGRAAGLGYSGGHRDHRDRGGSEGGEFVGGVGLGAGGAGPAAGAGPGPGGAGGQEQASDVFASYRNSRSRGYHEMIIRSAAGKYN